MPTNILLKKILPKDQLRQQHPLKERIRKLGLRQKDIAVALGCSDSELSQWLNNRYAMPCSAREKLEEILDKLEAEVASDE